jgi:hypothetical protein
MQSLCYNGACLSSVVNPVHALQVAGEDRSAEPMISGGGG